MKHGFLCILLLALPVAAETPREAMAEVPALLVGKDGSTKEILLSAATRNTIRYRETGRRTDAMDARIPDDGTIFLHEPREYSEAMDLYQGRRYLEAKAKFIAVKEHCRAAEALENSHAALAAFYEMECLRKLGDLDGLAAALQKFTRETLTRETQLKQIELYVLWDAVRTRSWERLDILAKERETVRLPGDQRAQVAYCQGLALEGLNRRDEALAAYQTAMTADSGASEEITRLAALRIMAIHQADPAVQTAMKAWGTKDEDKTTRGRADLLEAAAVARLFEMSLGAGTPLPREYEVFRIYRATSE